MVSQQIKRHTVSYKYALKGLCYALKTQPNFWVHLFWASVAVGLGVYFSIATVEWLVLTLAISSVLITEMVNTSLETVTDGLKEHKKTEQDDYYIMVAKDVAAGAVLLSAISSIIIGFIVFLPRLLFLLAS